jgi:uncharacterized protein YecE (DUF72 family)
VGGVIKIGVGGWTYEPWRGVFYPTGLPHKRELEFASQALSSIEINGTYYSTFKPQVWRSWCEETPDGFTFAVKASRYCTNRKVLAEAEKSINRFIWQGLTELGDKLGPINWQLLPTKTFDAADLAAFFELLPRKMHGISLRHAVEVRHPSFETEQFYDLARKYGVAIVYAEGDDVPQIDQPTAGFTYARLMTTKEDLKAGVTGRSLKSYARKLSDWAKRGDVFVYFIRGAKVRNPAAAAALIKTLATPKAKW